MPLFCSITASGHPEHPYRDQHHFYTLRAFLQQLRSFEPETEVPERPLHFGLPRRRPYIFSECELVRLMRATKRLRLFDEFRVATVRTLIGLLASAGLRIGEALRLKLEDLSLAANLPYLVIRDTKFGKSRNVVLHPTVRDHLRRYPPRQSRLTSWTTICFPAGARSLHWTSNPMRLRSGLMPSRSQARPRRRFAGS